MKKISKETTTGGDGMDGQRSHVRIRGGERTKGNIPVETWSEKGKEERGKEKRKLINGGHGRRRRMIWSETWKRLLKEAERKAGEGGEEKSDDYGATGRDRR